jgi:hypothetical protein
MNPFDYWDAVRDEMGAGDARRCPRHPSVKVSSDDGLFDAPCGECEAAADDAEMADEERDDAERILDANDSEDFSDWDMGLIGGDSDLMGER